MTNNMDVVAEARTWLGVRWAHQGRSRAGVDCVGLAICTINAVRGTTFDAADYPRISTDEAMRQGCDEHLQRVDVADVAPGDVLVLGFGAQRHMALAGDYVHGGLSLIHAWMPSRKVVEMRLDDAWRARIVAAYRLPPLPEAAEVHHG